MNTLNIALVILVVGGNVGNICSTELKNLVPSAPAITPPPESTMNDTKPTISTPNSESTNDLSSTTPSLSSTTSGPIPSTTAKKCHNCFENTNGMCVKIEGSCDIKESSIIFNNIEWHATHAMNCAQRDLEEVKVCTLDCQDKYRIGRCPSTLNPVCGYSIKTRTCRKFANPCLLKQDVCRYPTIMDWRVTQLYRCQYLRVGGPAGTCV